MLAISRIANILIDALLNTLEFVFFLNAGLDFSALCKQGN